MSQKGLHLCHDVWNRTRNYNCMHYLPRRQWRGWSNRGAPTSEKEAKKSSRHPRRYLPLRRIRCRKDGKMQQSGATHLLQGRGTVRIWEWHTSRCLGNRRYRVAMIHGNWIRGPTRLYRRVQREAQLQKSENPVWQRSRRRPACPPRCKCVRQRSRRRPTCPPRCQCVRMYLGMYLFSPGNSTTQSARVQSCAVPVVY